MSKVVLSLLEGWKREAQIVYY